MIAPALATVKESLSETTPLRQLASEESTRQELQEQVPPPPSLGRHVCFSLEMRLRLCTKVAKHLAELTLVAS